LEQYKQQKLDGEIEEKMKSQSSRSKNQQPPTNQPNKMTDNTQSQNSDCDYDSDSQHDDLVDTNDELEGQQTRHIAKVARLNLKKALHAVLDRARTPRTPQTPTVRRLSVGLSAYRVNLLI
jgi:hypothetical protein